MFYLWRDKNKIFLITDYREVRESDGRVYIDGHGFIEVELVYKNTDKRQLLNHAQKIVLAEPNVN